MSHLIIAMHELPLESTGGGVLLRELLRYYSKIRRTIAIFPVYPHQMDKVRVVCEELTAEGVESLPLPVTRDWGRWSFTLRRLILPLPGCVVAFQNPEAKSLIAALANSDLDARWLLVSPFAAAYLPNFVSPERVSLYYTNVDGDIIMSVHRGFWRKIEERLERRRVSDFVRKSVRLAGYLGAITQANAAALTTVVGTRVNYIPPLMAPRFIDRSRLDRDVVLITTNYTYPHNRLSLEWFLREVWPLVGAGLHLEVTGLDDGFGTMARLLSEAHNSKYLGFLSKPDLEVAFARCGVVVNPTISGSGFQIKMLDALSRGLPLATTTKANPLVGAVESSDDPRVLAKMIESKARGLGGATFDYAKFYSQACSDWDDFII